MPQNVQYSEEHCWPMSKTQLLNILSNVTLCNLENLKRNPYNPLSPQMYFRGLKNPKSQALAHKASALSPRPQEPEPSTSSSKSLLKPNMYFALLWLKKIVRLHVVVFWGSLLHNLRLSAVANFLFLATPKQ